MEVLNLDKIGEKGWKLRGLVKMLISSIEDGMSNIFCSFVEGCVCRNVVNELVVTIKQHMCDKIDMEFVK